MSLLAFSLRRAALAASGLHALSAAPGGVAPTIDLTAEKHRQMLVDREPGQYLGHVTSALIEALRRVAGRRRRGQAGVKPLRL